MMKRFTTSIRGFAHRLAGAQSAAHGDYGLAQSDQDRDYAARLTAETLVYKDVVDINVLPEIFHYWSNKYLRPMIEEYGFSNPDQFFAKYLAEGAHACGDRQPRFVSIGAGNCDTEVRVAKLLREMGLDGFTIECLDMNPHMLERGREMAAQEGVSELLEFVEGDFNRWRPVGSYAGIMANQSLHHVMNLEGLFDAVGAGLAPAGLFMTHDMIGRNGHMRWPEALTEVHRFWRELPKAYRYNRSLDRYEDEYVNWDCSSEGFEGIRAQDILRLLLSCFEFHLFVGFANVVDVFIDRAFGHNFDENGEWDRDFIDRVHEFDESAIRAGSITPTHMMAVMGHEQGVSCQCSRGITPEMSVRTP